MQHIGSIPDIFVGLGRYATEVAQEPICLREQYLTSNVPQAQVKAVVLACEDGDRGAERAGKAYSQLLDPIGDALIERGVGVTSIARSWRSHLVNDKAHNFPRKLSRFHTIVLVLAAVLRRLGLRYAGISIGAWVWRRTFRLISAASVVCIQPPQEMCRAAHQLEIPIFDFQHGTISVTGSYYERAKQNVAAGHDELNPSAILCWDSVTAERVSAHLALKARVVGHPGLVFGLPSSNRVSSEATVCLTISSATTASRVVLVADQWTQCDEDARERMYFMKLLAECALLEPKILWVVRPHPVQYRTMWDKTRAEYAVLFGANDRFLWGANLATAPVYDLFAQVDVVIARSSSIAIEAGMASIPVALCGSQDSQSRADDFADDHRADVNEVALTSQAVLQWVNAIPKRLHRSSNFHRRQREQSEQMDSLLQELTATTIKLK